MAVMRARLKRRLLSRRILRDTAGFSLIEVMVSASLVAIGLLPVAYIQSGGLRGAAISYNLLAANNLAVQLSDSVRAVSYNDPRLTATDGTYVAPSSTLSNANPLKPDGTTWTGCQSSSCGYTVKWKIADNAALANTKSIDIQVSWNDYGLQRTYVLSVLKAIGS
jgi:prepilin-type N-terminal cleavage/methylation domain-containing protein